MPQTLTLFHTAPSNVATFDRLLVELAPEVPANHIIDESVLRDARAAGAVTPEIAGQVAHTIRDAAKQDARVILCTCSTIGGCAEEAGRFVSVPVLRVDRPMAERAVTAGSRIIVAATLASTLEPTRELVLDEAQKAGKEIQIIELFCDGAWAKLEQEGEAAYFAEIAKWLREAATSGDVVTLAQASMAGAAALCADLPIPVLSSPRLGLEAALKAYFSKD
jgi:hypothetical protein